MNNIQKAFKQKAKMGLRMATGGVVPFGTLRNSDGSVSADSMEHPLNKMSMVDKNALGLDISAAGQSDMAARLDARQNLFAASNNGNTSNVFAGIGMQPAQAAQGVSAQPTIEQDVAAREKRIEGLKDRLRALGSPGYKEGGIVQDFTGKGRPDKDTVPAMLAHGEAVLPAKTVASLGGPEAIEELIESTNGKPSATAQQKKGLRGGVLHAYTGFPGDTVDPRELRPEFRSQAQTPVIEPAAKPGTENLRNVNADRALNKAAEAYRPAMNAGSANDALRAAGKIPPNTAQVASQAAQAARAAASAKPAGLLSRAAGVLGNAAKVAVPVIAAVQAGRDPLHVDDAEEGSGEGLSVAAKKTAVAAGDVGTKALDMLSFGLLNTNAPYREAVTKVPGVHMAAPQERAEADTEFGDLAGAMTHAVTSTHTPDTTTAADNDRTAASSKVTLADAAKPQTPEERRATNALDLQNRSDAAQAALGVAQKQAGIDNVANNYGAGAPMNNARISLRAMANDPAVREAMQTPHDIMGDGIKIGVTTTPDGRKQVVYHGGVPTKDQYLAADGTTTNDWTKTAQYAQGVAQANKDKALLAQMERDRAMRDLGSNNERDVRTAGLRLANMNEEGKAAATLAKNQLEMQKWGIDRQDRLNEHARAAAKDKRDFEYKENEDFDKQVDKYISDMSVTDGKVDPAKQAMLRKYMASIPREKVSEGGKVRDMSNKEYFQHLIDNHAVDMLIEGEGRHWLTPESPWAGERTKLKKTQNTGLLESIARGALPWQEGYKDERTGRMIFGNDALRTMSPNQIEILKSRLY